MRNKKVEEAQESTSAAARADGEEIQQLMQAVEQKSKEAAENQDKYLRTYADFENYRKRMQRDMADFRKFANEQMGYDLLSVLDHLELAIKHAAEAGDAQSALLEGVRMTYKQLSDVLEKYGIKAFESHGEQFDPNTHDAVAQEITDSVPDNTVVNVLQKGYRYHDKVLRHAKVSVAKRPAAAQQPEGAEPNGDEQKGETEGND